MRHTKMYSFFGLKWNPFTADVPHAALWLRPPTDSFCKRVENMCSHGGFALVTGEPGNGKTVTLRLLMQRLGETPDVHVGIFSRPQSGLPDFYRELGDIFGVDLKPHNRWRGFKDLRARWQAYAESSLIKPILLIDEAQEMPAPVLNELRILTNGTFDTDTYLTVIIAGDSRLISRLRHQDLLPLSSRIRTRLVCESATPGDLRQVMNHALKTAGNPKLITESLRETLIEHAGGNYRSLMVTAGELLLAAFEKEMSQLNEKLFFEMYENSSGYKKAAKAR